MDEDVDLPIHIIQPLMHKAWLIGVMMLAGFVCSFMLKNYCIPKYYRADSLLFIWPARTSQASSTLSSAELNLISQLVNDFKVLVRSRAVIQEVANQLRLNADKATELVNHIQVITSDNTRHLQITVFDQDPVLAAAAANAVGNAFSGLVAKQMSNVEIQVIDPAIVPENPVTTNSTEFGLLGAGIGMIISVLLIMTSNAFDTRIQSAKEAQALTGLPVIGAIPKPSSHPISYRYSKQTATDDIFRSIRTNIEFADMSLSVKSLTITSSGPREGKTAAAAHLAVAYAQMGCHVLLVDADMRWPAIHRMFGTTNHSGLSDLLRDPNAPHDMIIATRIDGLDFLPAGPVDCSPADLLMSPSMAIILKNESTYDKIIIDCPPVGLVTDAVIIAAKTDAAVLIVKAGVGRKPQLLDTLEQLRQVGSRLIGLIVNDSYFPCRTRDQHWNQERLLIK